MRANLVIRLINKGSLSPIVPTDVLCPRHYHHYRYNYHYYSGLFLILNGHVVMSTVHESLTIWRTNLS